MTIQHKSKFRVPTGWGIYCYNDFCSGPKHYNYIDGEDRPNSPIFCPTCGWPATVNCGIEPIYENDEEEDE